MQDSRGGARVVWTAALAFVLQFGSTANLSAQSCFSTCTDTITPPSASSDEIHAAISLVSGTCTTSSGLVEDGTYVKQGSQLTIHSWTFSDGYCVLRTCSGWPLQCVQTWEGARYVQRITKQQTNPDGSSGPGYIAPYPGNLKLQTFDSHNNNTTGPLGATLLGAGTYTMEFQSTISKTNCNIEPGASPVLELRVHAVACEPKFLNSNGKIPHLDPAAPNGIEVFLDLTSMAGAAAELDAAIADVNSHLSGSAPALSRVTADCGTGPYCIKVVVSGSTCGFAQWDPPDSAGVHTGGLRLLIHPSWQTFSDESLQRTFVHELYHFYGLDNYSTTACGVDDAVMQPNFVCGPGQTPRSTAAVEDYIPVNETNYGGQTPYVCGF